MKKITKIVLIVLTIALTLSAFYGCGQQTATPETSPSANADSSATAENNTSTERTKVKLGVTGAIYETLWKPTVEKLADEGIDLELVQFSDFSLPNNALDSGDIQMNAFQHHAYFENDKSTNNYEISTIADTFVIAMNLFSKQYSSVDEIPEGSKIAVPNDATNYGRALLLLQDAGLLTLKEGSGKTPTTTDIETKKVELLEANASMTYQYVDDSEVAAAVVNGNYAASYGVDPDSAIFYEKVDLTDNSFTCVIAVRSEDVDNEIYKKIADTFCSDETKTFFEENYKGFFIPAWDVE